MGACSRRCLLHHGIQAQQFRNQYSPPTITCTPLSNTSRGTKLTYESGKNPSVKHIHILPSGVPPPSQEIDMLPPNDWKDYEIVTSFPSTKRTAPPNLIETSVPIDPEFTMRDQNHATNTIQSPRTPRKHRESTNKHEKLISLHGTDEMDTHFRRMSVDKKLHLSPYLINPRTPFDLERHRKKPKPLPEQHVLGVFIKKVPTKRERPKTGETAPSPRSSSGTRRSMRDSQRSRGQGEHREHQYSPTFWPERSGRVSTRKWKEVINKKENEQRTMSETRDRSYRPRYSRGGRSTDRGSRNHGHAFSDDGESLNSPQNEETEEEGQTPRTQATRSSQQRHRPKKEYEPDDWRTEIRNDVWRQAMERIKQRINEHDDSDTYIADRAQTARELQAERAVKLQDSRRARELHAEEHKRKRLQKQQEIVDRLAYEEAAKYQMSEELRLMSTNPRHRLPGEAKRVYSKGMQMRRQKMEREQRMEEKKERDEEKEKERSRRANRRGERTKEKKPEQNSPEEADNTGFGYGDDEHEDQEPTPDSEENAQNEEENPHEEQGDDEKNEEIDAQENEEVEDVPNNSPPDVSTDFP
ncbi:hypothetical protein BLNAU_7930 [Blattamonas nauphoetae]|uniref:Uncharacterized protein n=1 Tax=Blattamonas nauphoetae TaxID=2049346 RepID=A0ABQ9Y055_9EUKA|nr:hypothetical protein BLNAU_7930 [Blattamonas nauphoetae]